LIQCCLSNPESFCHNRYRSTIASGENIAVDRDAATAAQAGFALRLAGYENVRILQGGFAEWKAKGGLDAATEWAKAQGCESITLYGRKGWERVLDSHGFEPVMVVLERKI
jgi:hypothetical protein